MTIPERFRQIVGMAIAASAGAGLIYSSGIIDPPHIPTTHIYLWQIGPFLFIAFLIATATQAIREWRLSTKLLELADQIEEFGKEQGLQTPLLLASSNQREWLVIIHEYKRLYGRRALRLLRGTRFRTIEQVFKPEQLSSFRTISIVLRAAARSLPASRLHRWCMSIGQSVGLAAALFIIAWLGLRSC